LTIECAVKAYTDGLSTNHLKYRLHSAAKQLGGVMKSFIAVLALAVVPTLTAAAEKPEKCSL
jgi:hypothetical protein